MATETAVDVVMPQMGVSVSEGTVTKWLKREGEQIEADEPLLEISTDKVDTEVPSPASGTRRRRSSSRRARRSRSGRSSRRSAALPARPAPAPEPEPARGTRPEPPAAAQPPAAPEPRAPVEQPTGNGKFVSPVVARIAAEHGIDPSQVPGTGRGGRVTKQDILAFVEPGAHDACRPGGAPAAARGTAAAPAPQTQPRPSRRPARTVEPVTAMRRGIAEHMRRSLDTAAHVTSAIEVDMSKVVAAREVLKKEYQAAYGVNPTYLAFIARATVDTLQGLSRTSTASCAATRSSRGSSSTSASPSSSPTARASSSR